MMKFADSFYTFVERNRVEEFFPINLFILSKFWKMIIFNSN